MRNAHALSTASRRRLDHHGIADLVRDPDGVPVVLDHAEEARNGRNPGLCRGLFGFDLVAHCGDRGGIGPDENQAGVGERARKRLALRQEAVAGMNGLRPGRAADVHDFLDDEIALGRRRRSDQNGLIGHLDVKCVAIGFRIHGYGFDAHPASRLDDPAGDLAAIGDQYPFEHLPVDLQP